MYDHLVYELALADVAATEANKEFEDIEANLIYYSEDKEKWRIEAGIKNKSEYQAAEKRMLEAAARYKVLHSLAKGYEQKCALCSREISRRQHVLQTQVQVHRVQ